MSYKILQAKYTTEVQKEIEEGFSKHAMSTIGFDGFDHELISFEIREDKQLIGCIIIQMFWGQLYIKDLFVQEGYRRPGLGKKLMDYACDYGRKNGATFAMLETLSFQAPAFYEKLGFEILLASPGYKGDVIFYHLKKWL